MTRVSARRNGGRKAPILDEAVLIVAPEDWIDQSGVVSGERSSCNEMVGPGIGAKLRSLYRMDLPFGASTRHLRHAGEAVYFVAAGRISVRRFDGSSPVELGAGAMFHVGARTDYQIVGVDEGSVIGGPAPVDSMFERAPLAPSDEGRGSCVRFFHSNEPSLIVPLISADARFVVWYGVGARTANMNYVVLEPDEANQAHLHRYSEDTVHILEGCGTVFDVTNSVSWPVRSGDTIVIPAGIIHAIAADRGERVVSVGGPCPADLDLLTAIGLDVDAITESLAQE